MNANETLSQLIPISSKTNILFPRCKFCAPHTCSNTVQTSIPSVVVGPTAQEEGCQIAKKKWRSAREYRAMPQRSWVPPNSLQMNAKAIVLSHSEMTLHRLPPKKLLLALVNNKATTKGQEAMAPTRTCAPTACLFQWDRPSRAVGALLNWSRPCDPVQRTPADRCRISPTPSLTLLGDDEHFDSRRTRFWGERAERRCDVRDVNRAFRACKRVTSSS